MSHRRPSFFALPVLSLFFVSASALVACGGAIDTSPLGSGDESSSGSSGRTDGTGGKGGGSGATCTAYPSCDRGDQHLGGCSPNDPPCYSRSLCGYTIYCGPRPIDCPAYPSCEAGFTEVSSCPTDAYCVPTTVCGNTIYCLAQVAQCDGYPVCNDGDVRVPGPAGCFQDDATCYQRSMCGSTIWCSGPQFPDAGVDAGDPMPRPPAH